MLSTTLTQTATLWKPIAIAFDWVHQVATILDNDAQLDGNNVRDRLNQLLQRMERNKGQAGNLASGIGHFLKVTCSYAPGLFHCYDLTGLPRTNNDLEQLFGRWRHHQRRCTGRKVAPEGLCKLWQSLQLNCVRLQLRTWQPFLLQLGNLFVQT